VGGLRRITGCFITGQAAGLAAAMASQTGQSVHAVEVKALQQKLTVFVAYFPNA